jgi:succinylarginine dihydrolase
VGGYCEVNFDGLVGPTHHYGGYAFGNLASMEHRKHISHPKQAALQGLYKMKLLHDLGVKQAVLPPRMRPSASTLRRLGFAGSDKEVLTKAAKEAPHLLYITSSSASMWAANCATLTPSVDTSDRRLHISIANLASQFHRTLEAEESFHLLRLIFPNETLFAIHPPLPKAANFGDEGAANHTRFCSNYGEKGVHLFVYGKSLFDETEGRFPLRQTREASEAVARRHGLDPSSILFAQQSQEAVDAGVIHNDVISVGNRNFFLYHEKAFQNTPAVISDLQKKCPLKTLCVTEEMLSLEKAVKSYFFNGQIVTLPNGEDLLLLPEECRSLNLDWLPLKRTFVDLTESMQNGGGPACLRFRCVVNEKELSAIHPPIFLNDTLHAHLKNWIETHYRDSLTWADLQDPLLWNEIHTALSALSQILHLPPFYNS